MALKHDDSPEAADAVAAWSRRHVHEAMVDSGVALVTSAYGAQNSVYPVTFFAETSHVPPLLRIALPHGERTLDLVRISGRFGLSLLARGQEQLALTCAVSVDDAASKLDALGIEHRVGEFGVPLLPGCLTTSECLVVNSVVLPDHTMFVGEIMRSHRQSTMAYRDTLLVSNLAVFLGTLPPAPMAIVDAD